MSDNEIKPVASVGIMPGTSGFTMACFSAADVPAGTDVYDQSAIDRLTAERDAAVADAERYRWLRQLDNAFDYRILSRTWSKFHTPCQLDATIDAALSETE